MELDEEGDGAEARFELEASKMRERRAIERFKGQLRALELEAETLERDLHRRFHPFWGPLFKAGAELSSFGDQVEEFACLYTARASNLSFYSPMHYFQSPRDWMPHELRAGE